MLAVVAAAFAGSGAAVWAVTDGIGEPAVADVSPQRLERPAGDLAVVYDSFEVDQFVIDASDVAARRIGATASLSRSGAVGLQRVVRGATTVHGPPAGYLIPMTYVSFPRGAIAGVFGRDVSQVLDSSSVVLNQMTAELMGAQVGDLIDVRGQHGGTVRLRVAAIQPYERVGGTELIFDDRVADRLGVFTHNRVVVFGITDRGAFDQAMIDVGITGRSRTKINRSWSPPDPDDTISTARTKVALGEPWYRINSDESVSMHPDWIAANLTPGRILLSAAIPVRARCHVRIVDDLRAALDEVAAAGLGWAIEVGNTNTYGGCYNPRYSRTSGYLSRHAYGQALDTNTVSNCQGCQPRLDCRVVRIFRKHNFAWGGNFRIPDGMHFEWVGERRDQIPYDSNYCDNIVEGAGRFAAVPEMGLDALIAGDDAGHVHSHDH